MKTIKQAFIRIVADIALINLALIAAFILRFIGLFWVYSHYDQETGLEFLLTIYQESLGIYQHTTPVIVIVCIVMFYLFGIYTHVRSYCGYYKVLNIAKALSIAWLVYVFLAYFLNLVESMPRSVLAASFLLSLALIAGVRLAVYSIESKVMSDFGISPGDENGAVEKVLIIGGAGYIGSVLARQLLDCKYKVRILDKLLYGDAAIKDILGHENLEFVEGDFRNVETVVRCIQGIDAVVHLGAIVGDPACAIDEQASVDVNLLATKLIAETSKGYGVKRFVFASTCSVYGAGDGLLNEHSALNPVSLYAETKIQSEQALLALADTSFAPIILRFATVFGMSYRPRFDLVVNLLTAKAVTEGEITIFGGDQWRPFVHVHDVARAIIRSLEAPLLSVRGQIFNVGDDRLNYRINDVGRIIHELIPEAHISYNEGEEDPRNYHVSFSKAKRLLNFTAKHSLEDGILEIKAAFEAGEVEDYKGSRYSNLRFLNEPDSYGFPMVQRLSPVLTKFYLVAEKQPA